jgi:Flp pilus assembly protein TadB
VSDIVVFVPGNFKGGKMNLQEQLRQQEAARRQSVERSHSVTQQTLQSNARMREGFEKTRKRNSDFMEEQRRKKAYRQGKVAGNQKINWGALLLILLIPLVVFVIGVLIALKN